MESEYNKPYYRTITHKNRICARNNMMYKDDSEEDY